MNTQDNSPTKSHDQNFSEEFVRGYFLRGFFGRAKLLLGRSSWIEDKIFNNNCITPNEIFNNNTPETVRKLANEYVDMMMKLYYSGWVIMGNITTAHRGKTYLENEQEWREAYSYVDDEGRELISGNESLDVLTLLLPSPKRLRLNNDPILTGGNALLDSGVLFSEGGGMDEDDRWRFIIRINDEYVVDFKLSRWCATYGFRVRWWQLIPSNAVRIEDAIPASEYWEKEPLRIIIEDDSGVNTMPIQFCVPPPNTHSVRLTTLNYSRLGFLKD
tara:strand:- start:46 stop:864 length:819 start_codon:yes stop_codon:yes gene_type:complete